MTHSQDGEDINQPTEFLANKKSTAVEEVKIFEKGGKRENKTKKSARRSGLRSQSKSNWIAKKKFLQKRTKKLDDATIRPKKKFGAKKNAGPYLSIPNGLKDPVRFKSLYRCIIAENVMGELRTENTTTTMTTNTTEEIYKEPTDLDTRNCAASIEEIKSDSSASDLKRMEKYISLIGCIENCYADLAQSIIQSNYNRRAEKIVDWFKNAKTEFEMLTKSQRDNQTQQQQQQEEENHQHQ
jgi:hypothetical protein